jgi:hypothetical protein
LTSAYLRLHEIVILGDIPGVAIRAVSIHGQRFTLLEAPQFLRKPNVFLPAIAKLV